MGLVCGCVGVFLGLMSLVVCVRVETKSRHFSVGRGAIAVTWGMTNNLLVPRPGAAPIQDPTLWVIRPGPPPIGSFTYDTRENGTGELLIMTRHGWMPAIKTERAQWEILSAWHPFNVNWYWVPRLQERNEQTLGSIVIPAWLMILTGLVSGYFLLPREQSATACRKCGFDMAGVPSHSEGSVRCPECGTLNRHPGATASAKPAAPEHEGKIELG